mgnify:CR=1 FL=1
MQLPQHSRPVQVVPDTVSNRSFPLSLKRVVIPVQTFVDSAHPAGEVTGCL